MSKYQHSPRGPFCTHSYQPAQHTWLLIKIKNKIVKTNFLNPFLYQDPQLKLMGSIPGRNPSSIQVCGNQCLWFLCNSCWQTKKHTTEHGWKHMTSLGEVMELYFSIALGRRWDFYHLEMIWHVQEDHRKYNVSLIDVQYVELDIFLDNYNTTKTNLFVLFKHEQEIRGCQQVKAMKH